MLLTDLSPTVHNSSPRWGLYLTLSLGHVLPHCGSSRKQRNLSPTPPPLSAIPRPFGFNPQVWPGAKMSPLHKLHTIKKHNPQIKFKPCLMVYYTVWNTFIAKLRTDLLPPYSGWLNLDRLGAEKVTLKTIQHDLPKRR